MFTTYDEALSWIHGQLKFGMKPGIKRMEWMMEYLGNPHQQLKCIHVGGTNGKGSTVTFLRSMLEENGYTIGTFTSPYIECFNERISVDGLPISDDEMLKLANEVKPAVDAIALTELGNATEFEIITTMFYYYFGKLKEVDFCIVEVGLGGRYDSTNIIKPLASIITNIGFDHVNILGNTYEQIAYEKAGIIKSSGPLFTCATQKEVLAVFVAECEKVGTDMFTLGHDFSLEIMKDFFLVNSPFGRLEAIQLSMIGAHQRINAAGAVACLLYLRAQELISLKDDKMLIGLKNAFWPGRFEKVWNEPTVILDGAHNLEGVETLVNTVKEQFAGRHIQVFFTALKDKDCAHMIEKLEAIADEITFVTFQFDRASKTEDLANLSNHPNKKIATNAFEAIQIAINNPNSDVIIITGSLYFISEIRGKLK